MSDLPPKEVALMAWADAMLQGMEPVQRTAIWEVLLHGVQKHGADDLAGPAEHLEHGLTHAWLAERDSGCREAESGRHEWAHAAARSLLALYAIKEGGYE